LHQVLIETGAELMTYNQQTAEQNPGEKMTSKSKQNLIQYKTKHIFNN